MSYKGIFRKAGIDIDNNTMTFNTSKDIVYRLNSSLTTGTIRGVNNTVTMSVESSANIVEGLRSAITANVKTGAWCNAIVGSINYSTSGAAHGMAASICAEMIPPNSSLVRGALYALDCEFGCGASSSWGSAGPVAFIKFENWGTAAHFSANAFLFHLAGETGAAGGLLSENSRTLRVRIGTTTKYLYLSDTEDDLGAMVVDSIVLNTAVAIPLLISATVSDTGIDISGTCANFGIDISGAQTAVGIAVSGTCGTYGLLVSGACSTAGIGITGAEVIGILIATSTPTIGVSITANCETAAISISGDQVLGTLFHATAAATAAHSVTIPTGITLGAGLDINATSTGVVTSGLIMQGTGTFTTGITLSATSMGTGIKIEGTITNDAILVGSDGTPLVYPLSGTQNTCVSIYADLTDPGTDKFFRGLYVRTRYMPSDLTGEASVYGIRGHVQTVATYNNNGDVEYVCGVHGMVQGVAEADIIGADFMVSGIRGELIGAATDWNVKSACAVEAKLGLTVVPGTATYYSAFHAYSPDSAATYADILSADGYFTTGLNFGSHVVSLVNLFSIDITGGPAVATTDATADKAGSIAILVDGVQKWLQYWPNAAS